MIRRVLIAAGAAATAATLGCGSDQSTNTTPPPLTPAALALHFDTLAGQLQASSPGDVRLTWYQEIDRIVALNVSPTVIQARVAGGPAVLEAATETDAFADSANGKKFADSTYHLVGWAPVKFPTQFFDLRVRFLPAGTGQPDTTAAFLTFYPDTTGASPVVDSTLSVALQVLSSRGTCLVTALHHLTVPPNPCTKVAVDWLVEGGTGLLFINPVAQVSGTYLTE